MLGHKVGGQLHWSWDSESNPGLSYNGEPPVACHRCVGWPWDPVSSGSIFKSPHSCLSEWRHDGVYMSKKFFSVCHPITSASLRSHWKPWNCHLYWCPSSLHIISHMNRGVNPECSKHSADMFPYHVCRLVPAGMLGQWLLEAPPVFDTAGKLFLLNLFLRPAWAGM